MKPLLLAHGEKLFLAVVIVLGGWLLLGAAVSASRQTSLGEKETKNLKAIQEAYINAVPPPIAKIMYSEHLDDVLRGDAAPTGLTVGRLMSATWGFTEGVKSELETKQAVFPKPSGFAAKANRGQVELAWIPPMTEYAKVQAYEIHRVKGGVTQEKPFATVAADASKTYRYVDTDVEPEMEYRYILRVRGSEDSRENVVIVKPVGISERDGVWYPEDAGPVVAWTPSNIDFECTGIYDDFGKKRAKLDVKRWNGAKGAWDKFRTDPGIAIGEPVVGKRPKPDNPMETELADSQHVLVDIKEFWTEETKEREGWVTGKDGKPVRGMVPYKVNRQVRQVILRKGDREVTVDVTRAGDGGANVPSVRTVPSHPTEPAAPDLLESLRKQLETRAGAEPSADTTAPVGSSVTKAFTSNNIFSLKVPTKWSELTAESLQRMPYPSGLLKDLANHLDKALTGSTPDSAMVIHHQALSGAEHREYAKTALPDDEMARLKQIAVELLSKRTLAAVEKAEVVGEASAVKPPNGPAMAVAVFRVPGQDATLMVMRYCMVSLPNLHLMSFVCREADFAAQRSAFEAVAMSFGM